MKPPRILIALAASLALPAALESHAQPVITKEPVSQSASLGANVTFQVTATGVAPLLFQWSLDQSPIPGATAAKLSLTNVVPAHGGSYTVLVSDSGGSATSKIASLDVDPAFTKITIGAIVTNTAQSVGAAWGDFDNDGFPDLIVSNVGADFLYRNNRDGTFSAVLTGPVVFNDSDGGSGVAWADYDNDGWLDLLVGGFGGPRNKLFHNNGDGTFTKATAGALTADGDANGVAWGDFSGDGFLDLMIASENGQPNRLYSSNGDGTFTKLTKAAAGNIASDVGHSIMGLWSDYDSDGDPDLLVTRFGGKNALYRNNADGTFTALLKTDTGDLDAAAELSSGGAWGDYDNDGDLDLFIAQGATRRRSTTRSTGTTEMARLPG